MKDLIFNEENHSYTYKGHIVPSVTTIVQRTIFFDKYRDVPEYILKQASEKGSLIHKEIEEYIKLGKVGFTEELDNFIKPFENMIMDYSFVSSEKQIGDENYAGTIDLKFVNKEGQTCLADIKTTSSLDTEYVAWQLSFYAELYEKIYKTHISRLYAIWLRNGECKITEVVRKSKEEIESVLEAYKDGRAYICESKLLEKFNKNEIVSLANALKHLKALEKFTKDFKKQIEEYMVENGIPSYDSPEIRISRGADTITREFSSKTLEKIDKEKFNKYNKEVISYEFDEESFKNDCPELYNQCLTEKTKKGRFTITLR